MANFNIAYLIELKDRFTRTAQQIVQSNKSMKQSMEDIKNTVVKMNDNLDQARERLKKFGSSTQSIGKSISGVGRDLAGISATVGGIYWKSLQNYQTQASAIATLDLSMKSRQASLGMTSKDIQEMASTMQTKSVFGDEGIIQNVSNQLLTFDKVNGQVFKRANQAVLDMTSKIYGANASVEQMKPMALALGKALNTPAEAMNSLGRVGVKFTKSQQDIVKYLVQTGQTAKAQEYILYQLESRYKGSAEVLGRTQPIKQLTNAFNDMLEPLGEIVQEFLIPLVQIATKTIAVFNSLNKPFKVFIVTVMGLIAIASPLLMVLGGVISAIGSISSGVGILLGVITKFNIITKIATVAQIAFNTALWTNPITWIIAGIVALVAGIVLLYKKCDWFRNLVQILWTALGILWDYIKIGTMTLWQLLQPALQTVGEWLSTVWGKVVEFGQSIQELWTKVSGILKPILDFGKFIFLWLTPLGQVINVISILIQNFDKVTNAIEKAKNAMTGFKANADAKVEAKQRELNASEANGSSTTDVNINMKAENGTKVTKSKVVSKGKNKPNVGVNQASKGR